MRQTIDTQHNLVPIPSNHQHARELEQISRILDDNPEMTQKVRADLISNVENPNVGREGMTADQVLRVLIIKQMNNFSYADLEFHLGDSACYQSFCRIAIGKEPKKKTLQRNIKKIRAETLEEINRVIIGVARERGVEKGRKVRTDCTVEETNIHEPSDSTLLFDVVRVIDRLLAWAKETGFNIESIDHCRLAKRRMLKIQYSKDSLEKDKLYRDLVWHTEKSMDYAIGAIPTLVNAPVSLGLEAYLVGLALAKELEHYVGLGRKVVCQTRRRVFLNEKVPASEKIVSIFEPHTDIIKKDRRETLFGHKLCLTTGASGLVLDCQVLDGNPADSTLAVEAIKRQLEIYGRVPRQAAFDGGFTSKANLEEIKALGVKDVMFHKKRSLKVHDMVKSSWVYKQLKRFRAGIEGGISFLKRCFGLGLCRWRGEASFKAYTWASVVSANLLMLARHALS